MLIRILQQEDAAAYRKLRLEGLLNSPDAFGSTYEREAAFSLDQFIERVTPTPDKFVLGAFLEKETTPGTEGELAGIVTFIRETGFKTAHKGHIVGMCVAAEARGQGIGNKLLLALIDQTSRLPGLEQLQLTVVAGNDAAKRMYLSAGFQVFGVERRALKAGDRHMDEEWMVLHLISD
ncbi:GNAT family N-acetyltransferase [Paenibacillus physcomitrellae]|uniref:GNAT family N-acetyltransferase n=1 Tax=Paenibacillus physcomitrellae TaxID=1619311 RepID=A0ABQ1FP31_9BACL|nr:GNAT family N-acetyltransferase [Paenibacillus physcomitrellae]GGA24213.1 GNAT family N-acetyltransferase [Paenibacillus physcomitrellae]